MASRPRRSSRQRLVETLAAGIAHEVRNPLNAIQLNLRILEGELAPLAPDRRKRIHGVLAAVTAELGKLDDFVAEFLRYARPPRVRREPVDVRALLRELAAFVTPECARRGVKLEVGLRGPAAIQADAFQLKHAVLNLVLNALQASRRGGRIVLSSAASGDSLIIRVRDHGEGLAADVAERMFDAFFTTREGGTGLGLPIARRIVEEHGGSLAVAGLPGAGTTATITLPAG